MAEVIGLIASVIGIIEGLSKSKAVFKKYVHTSSALRVELVPMLGKLTAFAGILRGLQLECELDESDEGRLQTLAHIKDPLAASERAVKAIEARLNRVISLGSVTLGFGKILDKETSAAVHVLDQTKAVLELALSADQRILMKSIESYVRNTVEDLRDLRHEEKLHYEDLREDLQQIWSNEGEKAEHKLKEDLLAWISQINYSSNFHAASMQIREEDGAGDWFIRGKEFEAWRTGSGQNRLLLTGICELHSAGAGKTVLASRAITELARTKPDSKDSSNVLYFFFDFNDVLKQTTQGMLRTLIYQVVAKLEKIPLHVRRLYSAHNDNARPTTPPSDKEWLDLLSKLLFAQDSYFIVIDALNECSDDEISGLQKLFLDLLSSSTPRIRWLVTCRAQHRLTDTLLKSGFTHIEMKSAVIDNDIESYLSSRLSTDASFASFGPVARSLIVSGIKLKASGMFRFAQCQLKVLEKLKDRRVKKVREVLDNMPKDLYATYSDIVGGLKLSPDWVVIERILVFATYSARPVTISEVAEFVILEDGMTTIDPSDRFEDFSEIIFLINSLVHVQDSLLSLAHQSVQEFIVTECARLDDTDFLHLPDVMAADVIIAGRCLQYLGFSQLPICQVAETRKFRDPNTRYLSKLVSDYPLLDYAASRWLYHVRSKEVQSELRYEINGTIALTAEPNLWKAWLMLRRADIWEKQLELSTLVCEVSVRCDSLLYGAPYWACNFWQTRQNYRVRADPKKPSLTGQENISATEPFASPKESRSITPHKSSQLEVPHPAESADTESVDAKSDVLVTSENSKEKTFKAKALYDFDASDDTELTFRTGDIILIEECLYETWYIGSLNGKKGQLPTNYVKRVEFQWGRSFYDLAILLLEVALQTPLFTDMNAAVENVSSAKDLKFHMTSLTLKTRKADEIMGPKYGAVIRECFSNVYPKDQKPLNLRESDEYAMTKLHAPLQNMLRSGFRASRAPLPRYTRQLPSFSAPKLPLNPAAVSAILSEGTLQSQFRTGGLYGRPSSASTAQVYTQSAVIARASSASSAQAYTESAVFARASSTSTAQAYDPTGLYARASSTSTTYAFTAGATLGNRPSSHESTFDGPHARPAPYTHEYRGYAYTSRAAPRMPPVVEGSVSLSSGGDGLAVIEGTKELDEQSAKERMLEYLKVVREKEDERATLVQALRDRVRGMNALGPFELDPSPSSGRALTIVEETKELDGQSVEEWILEYLRVIREKEQGKLPSVQSLRDRIKEMNALGPFELVSETK